MDRIEAKVMTYVCNNFSIPLAYHTYKQSLAKELPSSGRWKERKKEREKERKKHIDSSESLSYGRPYRAN